MQLHLLLATPLVCAVQRGADPRDAWSSGSLPSALPHHERGVLGVGLGGDCGGCPSPGRPRWTGVEVKGNCHWHQQLAEQDKRQGGLAPQRRRKPPPSIPNRINPLWGRQATLSLEPTRALFRSTHQDPTRDPITLHPLLLSSCPPLGWWLRTGSNGPPPSLPLASPACGPRCPSWSEAQRHKTKATQRWMAKAVAPQIPARIPP